MLQLVEDFLTRKLIIKLSSNVALQLFKLRVNPFVFMVGVFFES